MAVNVNMSALFPKKVVLASGKEFDGTAAATMDSETLILTLSGDITIAEAYTIFSNPEETSKITSVVDTVLNDNDPIVTEYVGYTNLTGVQNLNGVFKIWMKK